MKATYGNVHFEIGQVFPNFDIFKQAIKDYAIYEGSLCT